MRFAVCNPMTASCQARWAWILGQFATLQVVAFAGTKQHRPSYLSNFTSTFAERIAGFDIFHWPCATTSYSNTSTGVSIAFKQGSAHRSQYNVFSPPEELQGHAGAVLDSSWRIPRLYFCFNLPPSGSKIFKHQCDDTIVIPFSFFENKPIRWVFFIVLCYLMLFVFFSEKWLPGPV